MNFNNPNKRENRKRKEVSSKKCTDLVPRKIPRKQHPSTNQSSVNIAVVAGNWIEAVGSIISAIGSPLSHIFTEQTLTDFNVIGNILEAGGTAIAAEGEEGLLNIVGEQLQAIGAIITALASE